MAQETKAPMSYWGTFERSLDPKKRVAVPSAWVEREGQELLVVPHPYEGYLLVMERAELERWEQKFLESKLPPAQQRQAIRKFYASVRQVATDKQGRILLPAEHCDWAGLNNDVVFLGARSRFEIWAKDRYQAMNSAAEDPYRRAAEEIGL